MKASLFLDTTDRPICGLLDEQYRWINFYEEGKKGQTSSQLHTLIHHSLKEAKVKIWDLQGLFTVAGPGSYTGVRLGEGVAQVFEWQGFPTFSITHFEIPQLLYKEAGAFVTQAFKGEFFYLRWKGGEEKERQLLPWERWPHVIKALEEEDTPLFIVSKDQIPSKFAADVKGHKGQKVIHIIRERGEELFPQVAEKKMRSPIYYFRHLHQEFPLPGQQTT